MLSLITIQESCANLTKSASWQKVEGVFQAFECGGYESCKMAQIVKVQKCSGANSCEGVEMDGPANQDVWCVGKYSCSSAYFYGDITGDVLCMGYKAVC